MAWRHKSKDVSKRMTSREFSDYPSSELIESTRSTGGRKPFSPIAEEDNENLEGEEKPAIKSRPLNVASPRSSMSPNHSSVSPVSSGSDHSSPRSPTTAHTHLPPPSSQPPPLPPSQLARPHPPTSTVSLSGKPRSSHSSKSSSRGITQHVSGMGPRSHTHHPPGHLTAQPRSRKPYETQHVLYPKHTVGPVPNQHSSGPVLNQHSSGPMPSQHSSGPMPSQHSSAPYQWVRPGGVGKSSHGVVQEGPAGSKYLPYDPVVPGNISMVNSKIVPTKLYPTPVVTNVSHLNHSNERGSPEHSTNESINDPGERGSPSGESSPSSTPNSTLGKQIHRQNLTESIQSESKLTLGEVASREARDGREAMDESVSKPAQQPGRGTTTVQMGNISLSVQNTRHRSLTSTNQKVGKQTRTLEARKNEGEEPIRILQPPKASVSQANQNGNNSGGAAENDKETPPTNDKDRSENGSASVSPVGVATNSSHAHSTKRAGGQGVSPSSSMEELANINEEEEETDSAQNDVPLPKADSNKSKHHSPASHPHQPHYPHPSHHHTGHTDPSVYDPNSPYVSHSQPSVQSLPQGIAQGIIPPASSLSQGTYMYEPHRSDTTYTHTSMYPSHPPSIPYDGPAGRHHHISPPHAQKYVVPPQSMGYRQPPVDYVGSHDRHPGSHDHHMTGAHRGMPPGMQFIRGEQYHVTNKLPRPDHPPIHYTKANISKAHEAAGTGDLKTLHRMLTNHEIDLYGYTEHQSTLAHKAALHGRLQVIQFLVERGLPLTALQIPDELFSTPAMLSIQGGSVECLQWLVEEGKVPFQVWDTGGETLMHHAAFHGQVKCLEWLLKTVKKRNEQTEIAEILDESGVTPAHFAAQGGHLDCLQLLIDYGYSVVHADREGQKPLDWADATGQSIGVRYLMMYETCWALSGELAHMAEQLAAVQNENSKLREALTHQEKDHDAAITKLLQNHEERMAKMREHHVDLMASILHIQNDSPTNQASGASGGASNKIRTPNPVRKAPSEPPAGSQKRSTRPPIPPEANSKKRATRGTKDRGHESGDQPRDEPAEIDYRTATPQEVLEKQMTSVAQRMNASREARKRQGGMTRTYSPLTPIIQRLYSSKTDEDSKSERPSRSQRHTEDVRRSAPKVKFSKTITEFPEYSRYDNSVEGSARTSSSPGQSPSHSHHGNKADGESARGKVESSEHSQSRKSSDK